MNTKSFIQTSVQFALAPLSLAVILTLGPSLLSFAAKAADDSVQAQESSAGTDLVRKLRELELKTSEVKARPRKTINDETEEVLNTLSIGTPITNEGIPGREEEPSRDDLINSAYTASLLIRNTIIDAKSLPLGAQIPAYEAAAVRILRKSGLDASEQATRLVLNRSVSIVQKTIQWAGQNEELQAQTLAGFYENSFKLALAYINNPPAPIHQAFPRGAVGITYSKLLWSYSGGLQTRAFKAIVLLSLVGYLGQDLNSDLERRNEDYKIAVADIHELQHNNPAYTNILNSLARGENPKDQDLRAVRSKVDRILNALSAAQ